MTSIDVGAIGIVVLLYLYPRLSAVRLVGSDIAHAAPLTLLAGSGHWLMGDANWGLLGSLLIGGPSLDRYRQLLRPARAGTRFKGGPLV